MPDRRSLPLGLGSVQGRPDLLRRCRSMALHLVLALGLIGMPRCPAGAAGSLHPVATAMHIHSNWSTGDSILEALITRAQAAGVEVIFLTENHSLRFEYGVFPLRNLLPIASNTRRS